MHTTYEKNSHFTVILKTSRLIQMYHISQTS